MNPSRWHRIKSIYESVLSQDLPDRPRWIEQFCQSDPEAMEEVQRMLVHSETANQFFDRPVAFLGESGLPILKAGSLLKDRFLIAQLLGSGGMGQVYEAEDCTTGRRVALKTLQMMRPEALTLFKNEFRSLAGLLHPNLVTLFELYLVEDCQFFTMELVPGQDLVEYFQSRAASKSPEIHGRSLSAALRQIVDGVDALHRYRKIHCDLKPSNILVERSGNLKILDFGLVRDVHQHDWERDPVIRAGTLPYMSPEQASGLALSPSSDWYSLGVLLYEVLTGRVPFHGDGDSLLEQKRKGRFVHPLELVPHASKDVAELCVELLHPLPHRRPTADRLRDRLAVEPEGGWRRVSPPVPGEIFVGRERELAALEAAYAKLCDGEPSTIFVEGLSGIGKTTLIERFLRSVSERDDALIFAGKCYEQETIPYKALDSVVDSISRYLQALPEPEMTALLPENVRAEGRIFRALRWLPAGQGEALGEPNLDDVEIRRRGFAAFGEMLSNIGASRHMVLFIDDLQWGDTDSAVLLSDILTGPFAPRMLFLAAFRSGHEKRSQCLQTLAASEADFPNVKLEIEPLDDTCSRELARQLLCGSRFGGDTQAISRESGGNPYYLHQLALSGGRVQISGGIDELVYQTVQSVPPEGQRLLEMVAISGRPILYGDACASAAVDGSDPSLMIALRSWHLARTVGSGEQISVEVYHDRVREAIVKNMSTDRQRGLHLSLARILLQSSDRDLESTAVHFDQGGDLETASHLYLTAAETAEEALAFERAAILLGKSLDLGQHEPASRRKILIRRANAFSNAGRCLQAADAFESAIGGSSGNESRVLLRKAAYSLCVSGHVERGRAAYQRLLAQFGIRLPRSPSEAIRRLLWARMRVRLRGLKFSTNGPSEAQTRNLELAEAAWTVATGLGMIDVFGGAAFTAEGLLFALRAGNPFQIARSLLWEGVLQGVGEGGRRNAEHFLNIAKKMLTRLQDPYLDGMYEMAVGFQSYQYCRFREAEAHFERAEAFFRDHCRGAVWETTTAQHQRIHASMIMGKYAVVAQKLPVLLQEARDKGDLYSATTLAVFPEVLNHLRLDVPDQALAHLRNALTMWPQAGMTFQRIQSLIGESWVWMYAQKPANALDRLRQQWPELQRAHVLRGQIHRIAFLDIRCRAALAHAAGASHPKPLMEAAKCDAASLRKESVPIGAALAEAAAGSLCCLEDKRVEATEHFEKATAQFQELEMELFAQSAARAAGLLKGGPQGLGMIAGSENFFREQGFRNPERMAQACIPLPTSISQGATA